MHPFSVLTLGIFVAGYITARWDLVTRLLELAVFAWDYGVVARAAKGFGVLSLFFFFFLIPAERLAAQEADLAITSRPENSFSVVDHFSDNHDMSASSGLMRVFWPSDATTDSIPGVLVGWRNSELDVTVAAILHHVEPRNVDNALRTGVLFRNSPYPIARLLERCGNNTLKVLGMVNPREAPTTFDPAALVIYTTSKTSFPRLYCPSISKHTPQIVLFDRPNSRQMQYVSLAPIALALENKDDKVGPLSPWHSVEVAEEKERERKRQLVEKLKLHTVIKHPPAQKESSLPVIIEQINCSQEINDLLHKNVGLVGTRPKRALSVSERVIESAQELGESISQQIWYIWKYYILPVMAQIFVLGLVGHRIAGELILVVLDWRPLANQIALKDVSATFQQVDIRLQQFCYWPIQYKTLQQRKRTWKSITNSHPDYIRFYNSLWLVANDVIIGIALGSYIIENSPQVAEQLDTLLTTWTIGGLQRMIVWLMGWPAGLKLNAELSEFLGDLFLWVIEYWAGCVAMLRPHLPAVVDFIGFSAFAGATMPISLLSDLVSILTLHIYSFYIASARIYNWQLTIIISLFHLFRGKKRNMLRNRIDSCDYDLDQLLLGTILFTLLVFLLPTVFVFYGTFASARMAIILFKALLDTLLACLNHFPLFAFMLLVKDDRRLPGGVRFELADEKTLKQQKAQGNGEDEAPTSLVHLKSIPLPLTRMLESYFQLASRISKHYVSPGVILCLITGRFVPPIHRKNLYSLQYNMLPSQRIGISELWRQLTTKQIRPTVNTMTNGSNYGSSPRSGTLPSEFDHDFGTGLAKRTRGDMYLSPRRAMR